MSENICYTDSYLRTVAASVREVQPAEEGKGALVVLDRTVFYPGGGGQPADRGVIRGTDGRSWVVVAARKAGDDIVHELEAGAEPPEVGAAGVYQVDLDWERRYRLMRTHTALHALCGVVWRDHGALVTGGNMEPGSGRMDFEFETMSGDLVAAIEAQVNAELASARPVKVDFLPRDEAFAIPDLIRTKVNLLPPGIDVIRTIEIEGLDLQADGGTHVASTAEVGSIRVTGYESKGRINKRIRIELADPA
ncbi:MAG: alanyl-tRNA editing protein [Chloroflexi bacterium]|nr:alanyl-tRNA editing protein [Chloroflexota bacterium]